MKGRLLLVLALALAAPFPFASAALASECGNPELAPVQATDHQLRSSTLCLINGIRAHFGVAPLTYNEALRHSATAHSVVMVRSGSFSHYGPAGSTVTSRVARAGYLTRVSFYRLAENIGTGSGARFGSPAAIVREWMHSPPHRANLLDPGLRDFGVGIARGDPLGGGEGSSATYTLDLGARER